MARRTVPLRLRDRSTAAGDHLVPHQRGLPRRSGGVLGIGVEAEAAFGYKHFLELLSVFTSPPVLSVRHGRNEIGLVPDESLLARPSGAGGGGATVLPWRVAAGMSYTWTGHDASFTSSPPTLLRIARWTGGGQQLGSHVARSIRTALCGADPTGIELSSRAPERLAAARSDEWWATEDTTTVVLDDAVKTLWWTFAGWKANLWLTALAAQAGCRETVNNVDDLTIGLDADADVARLPSAVSKADLGPLVLAPWITAEAIDGLKFAECLLRNALWHSSLAVSRTARRWQW